jgi:hypothetical protein
MEKEGEEELAEAETMLMVVVQSVADGSADLQVKKFACLNCIH